MKVVRQARLELSGGSTPDQLRPPAPRVLRDSGVGAMAPMAPKFFCACFPFIMDP